MIIKDITTCCNYSFKIKKKLYNTESDLLMKVQKLYIREKVCNVKWTSVTREVEETWCAFILKIK